MIVSALGRHALLGSVAHDLTKVVWVQRVQDVEEVITWWALALRVLVGEVGHEDAVCLEVREHRLDRELVVLWYLDLSDGRLLEELLLAHQDVFEEVLVDDRLVRQVELEAVQKKERISGSDDIISRCL